MLLLLLFVYGFQEQYEVLRHIYPHLDTALLSEILSFSHTITQEEATSLGIADFPLSNVPLLAALMVSQYTYSVSFH